MTGPRHDPIPSPGSFGGPGQPPLVGASASPEQMVPGWSPPPSPQQQGIQNALDITSGLLSQSRKAQLDDYALNSINYQTAMLRPQAEQDRRRLQTTLGHIGLDRERIGIGQGAANRELGFLGQERGMLDQMRALADRGLQNALGQLNERAEQSRRSTKSEYVRRGATFAPERGAKMSDIETELQLGTEQANIGTEKEKIGLDRQGLDISRGEAAQQDKLAGYGIDIRGLGLDESEARAALGDALGKLGYGQYMDIDSALAAIKGGDPQLAAIGTKALEDAQAFVMQAQGY